MARKFGSIELVSDGRALSCKGEVEVDPTETDVEVETCLDGTRIAYEMPRVPKITATIALPEGTAISDIAKIRDNTVRVITGHLKYTYPRALVKVTGGVNTKGEIGIEIYPLSKPIEEVVS